MKEINKPYPPLAVHDENAGGWHIRTKDGRTFSNLSMDDAVEIYHEEQEIKEKVVPFNTEN